VQALLDVIRAQTLPALGSQGVKLAREGRVSRASASPSELTLRVRAPGRVIAPTVTLYPEDEEWSCDCGSKVDPCAHVAAAVIAATRDEVEGGVDDGTGKDEGARVGSARLVYRLARRDGVLALTRVIVFADGNEVRLAQALSTEIARRKLPQALAPTHDDLHVDRLLGAPPREVISLSSIPALFHALAGAEISLDGKPIRVSGELIRPRAVVDDAPGGGFTLRIERDPSISEIVAMGAVRVKDTLHPIAEGTTTGEKLERLPLSRTFVGPGEAELVTQVLPELERRIAVTVLAKKLPRTRGEVRPRIAMDFTHQGHTLSVLPLLVYGDPPIARVDGDAVVSFGSEVPVRRPEEERTLLVRLRDDLNLVPGRRVDLDGQDAIRFAAKLREWQKKTGDQPKTTPFSARPLTPKVHLEDGRFDVSFEWEADGGDAAERRKADPAAVFRAFRDGLGLVPIEGGGWAPLPEDWLAKHGHRVMDLLAARDADKRVPRAALPVLGALCDALNEPRPPELEKLRPLLEGFEGIPRHPLPPDLTATLRHYQESGVDWLAFLRQAGLGAVLADDMGLGKTLQTICILEGRALVVCPKSVVYNWAEELARFRPGLRTSIYHGPRREIRRDADVTLTTYAMLRLDVDKLSQEEWDVIVLDEAQAIKNATSQTAQAAFELDGGFHVALSGTPVENRLEELWSVMRFTNPGLLGGLRDFQERYSEPIGSGNADAGARLRAKIRPFVLRRMKREVAPELPPRTDSVLHVELDETERAIYDAVRVAAKKEVTEKLAHGGSVLLALEALLRLRQAACHSGLIPGQTAESSSKVERLLEALEEAAADGHKALVFSQWTSLLDRIEPHLVTAGIPFTRLDGSTRDRGGVVTRFQSEEGPPVMLVSLKAGGTGLNLTAADHVFLVDPWWNPAIEDQAADRAHRIGQTRPVMVYRMVAKDTVEEKILSLKARKRALADAALGGTDQAHAITRDELLALLD
jgi:superfamily II DNA or RNA helicase